MCKYEKKSILPHFYKLLDQIYKEQGGICCYCGAKLLYPDTNYYSVEHVKPRSKYIELVGEYENLLLSCHISEEKHKNISDEVLSFGLTGKEKTAAVRKLIHCDEYKEDNEIEISPLDKNCDSRFKYHINGNVSPTVSSDSVSQKTIDILNLNCSLLVKQRFAVIDSFIEGENEMDEAQYVEYLNLLSNTIMDKDSNGMHKEFCFVIKSVVDSLL